MIGFLRFAGILNAAVWVGAAIFFMISARPAASSAEMMGLLNSRNFPYYSGEIARILAERLFHLELTCSILAGLHLLAEWLYLGKTVEKAWRGLVLASVALVCVWGWGVEPKMKRLRLLEYGVNTRPEERAEAARAFSAWQQASELANLLVVAGVAGYLWRVANPPDPTRFVSKRRFGS